MFTMKTFSSGFTCIHSPFESLFWFFRTSCSTVTVRGGSILSIHFIMAFSMLIAYKLWVKIDKGCVFLVLKKFDSWSRRGYFSSLFGSFPVKFPPQNTCFEHFYSTKRFVFEFQGESFEQFLSFLTHFRRFHHLRGFWQSTASSYRDCLAK